MNIATTIPNLEIRGEAEHRDSKGNLIVKHMTISPPKLPEQPLPPDPNCKECIKKYIGDFDNWSKKCKELMEEYEVILEYHKQRVIYADKHRRDKIPDKYRTGSPSPRTRAEAEREIGILQGGK